jgi:hypothetical protein
MKYKTAYLKYANAAELISIRGWRRGDIGDTLTLALPTVEVADGGNGKASPPATVTEYAGKAVRLMFSLVFLLLTLTLLLLLLLLLWLLLLLLLLP